MDSPILPAPHRGLSLTVLAAVVAILVAATGLVVWLYLDTVLVGVPMRAVTPEAPIEALAPVSEGITRLQDGIAPAATLLGS
jgi:hypothetical protein